MNGDVKKAIDTIKASCEFALGIKYHYGSNGTRIDESDVVPFSFNDPRICYKRSVALYVSAEIEQPLMNWEVASCVTIHFSNRNTGWTTPSLESLERAEHIYWQLSVSAWKDLSVSAHVEDDEDDEDDAEEQVVSFASTYKPYIFQLKKDCEFAFE